MLDYSIQDIKEIVAEILDWDDFFLDPIGNHELKRHLVYKISKDDHSLILKLYYKKNRWNREIAALQLLSESDMKVPNLLDWGRLSDGTEWVMIEYLPGQTFAKLKDQIPYSSQLNLMEEMGKELGKMHTYGNFEYFGNWDENGQSISKVTNYYQVAKNNTDLMIEELLAENYPEKELQEKAAKIVRENYDYLKDVKIPHLCHNDFDDRNVLIHQVDGEWRLLAVIDFEQCIPGNKDADLTSLYHNFFLDDPRFEDAFMRGYKRYSSLGEGFHEKLDFYLLRSGLSICSFAYTQASDYYDEAVQLLERILAKY